MATIRLDDQVSQIAQRGDEKLNDFIQTLISSIPPNRVVTQVMLDGAPLGARGKSDELTRTLEGVKELQIKTADKAIWAATGLDIALSCVERVQRSLLRAAELFREPESHKANQFFVHCIDGMERFVEAITITRCAMGLDFTRVATDFGSLQDTENSLMSILAAILELQERKEYEELADKVEYELLTNLSTWAGALRRLRTTANA